ncbi:histidine--tRNA ligase [bacterium]|nr:histidine--tRNA ligase [bacterium]
MSKQRYNAPRGTKDILPDESAKWQYIENLFRKVAESFGYREIRTPTFEEAGLFTRSIGEDTDIVSKEMYTFQDKGGRTLALRPEGTASVVRAYIEHGLYINQPFAKFYYITPLFRYERPQAGRYREHHQLGVEAIGSNSPYLDAEVIYLAYRFLDLLGLKEKELHLNSVGCPVCRPRYVEKLREFLLPHKQELCEDCQRRLDYNPLRVLDCKRETCQKITSNVPPIYDFLCPDCSSHFSKLQELLSSLDINFRLNPRLVRGLDYYTKTAFEIVSTKLGAQNSVCGGGRYDGLVEELGGPPIPAVGMGMGVERVLLALENDLPGVKDEMDVFVAVEEEGERDKAFQLLMELRGKGLKADMDYLERSLKSQLRQANRIGAKYALILRRDGAIVLKDMEKGTQKEVKLEEAIGELIGDEKA